MRERIDHELIGKVVDFDWRPASEQSLPYDDTDMRIVRKVKIDHAKIDCYGEIWLCSKEYADQKASRVVKIH